MTSPPLPAKLGIDYIVGDTQMARLITAFAASGLLLVSASALASGVTSAPSEASSETSSKQSSEGTSGSSSDSSPERNNFVANNLTHIELDAIRGGGAATKVLAYQTGQEETVVVGKLQSWLRHNPEQRLQANDVNHLLQ